MPAEPLLVLSSVSDLQDIKDVDLHFFRKADFADPPAAPQVALPIGNPGGVGSTPQTSASSSSDRRASGPPLEEETSSEESLGQPEEISFLVAETSQVLHANLHGKPACGSRGVFRGIGEPMPHNRLCRARACACIFSELD